jgi:hypothetical protein
VKGDIWTIDKTKKIYRNFKRVPGLAHEIVTSANGFVMILSRTKDDRQGIHLFNPDENDWMLIPKSKTAKDIALTPNGEPWFCDGES